MAVVRHALPIEPIEQTLSGDGRWAITGIEFEIRLPTAQLRLDSSELALEEDIDAEVERLDEQFRVQGTP